MSALSIDDPLTPTRSSPYVPIACQWTVGANVSGSPGKTATPPAIVKPVAVTFVTIGVLV